MHSPGPRTLPAGFGLGLTFALNAPEGAYLAGWGTVFLFGAVPAGTWTLFDPPPSEKLFQRIVQAINYGY